jgi:hypothetical protein
MSEGNAGLAIRYCVSSAARERTPLTSRRSDGARDDQPQFASCGWFRLVPDLKLLKTLGAARQDHRGAGQGAWIELFKASVSLFGDELRWRVAHAERALHRQHRRLHKVHRTRLHRFARGGHRVQV